MAEEQQQQEEDDVYLQELHQYGNVNDDTFYWNSNNNVGFDGVSVMPLSCIN